VRSITSVVKFVLTPYIQPNPNFGGVPVAPDRRCWASTIERMDLKLGYMYLVVKLAYFRRIPTYVIMIPDRHGRTDGRTTYCRITALCASIAR